MTAVECTFLELAARHARAMREEGPTGSTYANLCLARECMKKAGLDPQTDEAWKKAGILGGLKEQRDIFWHQSYEEARACIAKYEGDPVEDRNIFVKAAYLDEEYRNLLERQLKDAFLDTIGQYYFEKYISYAQDWAMGTQFLQEVDSSLDDDHDPEEFMAEIEDLAHVHAGLRGNFRASVVRFVEELLSESEVTGESQEALKKISVRSHPVLCEAIMAKLEKPVPIVTFSEKRDPGEEKASAQTINTIRGLGYTDKDISRIAVFLLLADSARPPARRLRASVPAAPPLPGPA